MRAKLSNNKGFTLIEVIVALAIGSLVLAALTLLFVDVFTFLSTTSDTDQDKNVIDALTRFVSEEVKYSTDVRIVSASDPNAPDLSDEEWNVFYVDKDIL